ncbi:MAG: hypothetical protein ACI4YB_02125 [Oscillospiraceae bacterium]
MNNNALLESFKMNINDHAQEIRTAQAAYLIAKAAEDSIKSIAEEIQRGILSEGDYFVAADLWDTNRRGMTERRITEPRRTYLMDEEIFINDFLPKCYEKYQTAGIADDRGEEYCPEARATDKRKAAEQKLLSIAVDILPECEEKDILKTAVNHWKYRDEILQIILQLAA